MTERTPAEPSPHEIASIQDAIDDIRAGRMVILVDDEDRENEGDLVVAAEHLTAEQVNFMAREGRGLICLALDSERANSQAGAGAAQQQLQAAQQQAQQAQSQVTQFKFKLFSSIFAPVRYNF